MNQYSKNKNTILHTICRHHEGIPPPKPASNTNPPKNKDSFSSFHQLGLSLDIIKSLWGVYRYQIDQDSLKYHIDNCPYKNHPSGNDSLFKSVGGFIDPVSF